MFDKTAWRKEYNQRPEVKQRSRESARRYRASHLEKCREDARRWRANHPELKPRMAAEGRLRNKEQHHLDKIRAVQHYSNPIGVTVCNNCGEQDIDVLSLDHIEGTGGVHRREINIVGSRFYHWLGEHDYPEGLQVLCWNCNRKKEMYRLASMKTTPALSGLNIV